MQKSQSKERDHPPNPNPLKRKNPATHPTSPKLKRKEEDPEANKWWEKVDLDIKNDRNEPKWEYLEHNGVQFPPFYKPHKIRINHKGEPIALNPLEEEHATYWSQTIGTEWENKKNYRDNFSSNFIKMLKKKHPEIQNFNDLDFGPIVKYLEEQKEIRKNRGPEERKVVLFLNI